MTPSAGRLPPDFLQRASWSRRPVLSLLWRSDNGDRPSAQQLPAGSVDRWRGSSSWSRDSKPRCRRVYRGGFVTQPVRGPLKVRETATMLWIGIGVTLLAITVLMMVVRAKRPADDLGSVSAHWVAAHRVEPRHRQF